MGSGIYKEGITLKKRVGKTYSHETQKKEVKIHKKNIDTKDREPVKVHIIPCQSHQSSTN